MEIRYKRLEFIQDWLAEELFKDRELDILRETYPPKRKAI